ncbi:uncharacterized protein LOC135169924 [Diachasmimorpha longicaudata]|uniref:uncharacterized protein LOC135169924 n=1 Tax=Diachasmimorpha longicaudata TaxID=58733 RepID=UPI0030B8BCD6
MESTAKLFMFLMIIMFCIGAVITRSIHPSHRHSHHHDRARGHRHFRTRHSGHPGGLGDLDQEILNMHDSVDGLDGHPIVKRHNEDFDADIKNLQNCSVCTYSVTPVPKSDVYDVPEDLVEVTCSEESIGESCSEVGVNYVCMQAFSYVKFGVKGNPGEFKKKKINTGCVCALMEIESLKSKKPEDLQA